MSASSIAVFLIALSCVYAQYPFGGGGCGGCPRPMCQPRMPCAAPMPMPMPMPVCPPPPPCPAQFCPPPPICPPPPPPPMPCPPPPPPMPRPSCPCMQRPQFYPSYVPQYYQPMMAQPMPMPMGGGCGGGAVVPQVRIPAQNDCCCGCSSPCKYKSVRRAAFAAKTVDPSCNSSELKNIILDNIIEDASESKRNIQKIAEETLGHEVNVICGTGEFSYIAHTDTFCQAFKENVTCYAFKPL